LNPDTNPIYLDYNATTPIEPAVLEAMTQVLQYQFGNPSSQHYAYGKAARDSVESARSQVAELIGCSASEIIFTSGATESCNLAIKGVVAAYREKGNHIIASMAEHKAVLEPLKQLANSGVDVTLLRPDACGRISPEQIEDALTPRTILVCAMAANNVLGTLNPVDAIGALCKKRGVLFFCDATQAVGKIPVNVRQMGLDLAAISAHKLYGPKGVGALYVRNSAPRVRIEPLIVGGGQERGLRGGTENVAGIVGFGKACQLAASHLPQAAQTMADLTQRLEALILQHLPDTEIVAADAERLCNTTMMTFAGVRAETLLRSLADQVCASTGSACDAAAAEAGYVLKAIGLEQAKIIGAVRFSIGRWTTPAHIDTAAAAVVEQVRRLRQNSP